MLLTKFPANRPFSLGVEAKNIFTNGGNLGFPIGMILAVFDLQVTAIIPTKANGLLVQEKKRKLDF